eukprot:6190092-Amphidinium_carterae.1
MPDGVADDPAMWPIRLNMMSLVLALMNAKLPGHRNRHPNCTNSKKSLLKNHEATPPTAQHIHSELTNLEGLVEEHLTVESAARAKLLRTSHSRISSKSQAARRTIGTVIRQRRSQKSMQPEEIV